MREDLIEVFGEGLGKEQEEALLNMSEHTDYTNGHIDMAEFRKIGKKLLEGLVEQEDRDWREGYYKALSSSMSLIADRYSGTGDIRATLDTDRLAGPAQIDAWLEARGRDGDEIEAKDREPSVARVSVSAWEYEREFSWRSPASILGVLARTGEALRRLGWEAADARGYVLTGNVPAYSRVSAAITWDTRKFPTPRVELSIDPSASKDEVLAEFTAMRKTLIEKVVPFSERALEVHKHTSRLPATRDEWRASFAEWNERFPDVLWQFYSLREYKAAVRRVHAALLERGTRNSRTSVNKREYLGWPGG